MNVRLLDIEQKKYLIGLKYDNYQYFNPIQDINNNWIISEEEVKYCILNIEWIHKLPIIEYTPKEINI